MRDIRKRALAASQLLLGTGKPISRCQDDQTTKDLNQYIPPWQTLPKPHALPAPLFNGTARINNVDLWYGMYGAELDESLAQGLSPVVFLHGGFANSEYFGNRIHHLRDLPYTLVAIDSRAQGRSSDDHSRPITYDLMTLDVLELMDHLGVDRFSTVGWSDGSCIAFNLAMNYSSRVDRVFAFGGTYSYANINETALDAQTFKTYMEWANQDFERLSPTNTTFDVFQERMTAMWSTEPVWHARSFSNIPTLYSDPENAPIIWIVAADSEEAVMRSTPGELHSWVSQLSRWFSVPINYLSLQRIGVGIVTGCASFRFSFRVSVLPSHHENLAPLYGEKIDD